MSPPPSYRDASIRSTATVHRVRLTKAVIKCSANAFIHSLQCPLRSAI